VTLGAAERRTYDEGMARFALLAASGFLAGCSLLGASRAELHAAAHSLVPRRAAVIDKVEGDCVELARSPSCVHIYFLDDGASLGARTAAVRQLARKAGWRETSAEALAGGHELRFERRRLKAFVSLRRPQPGRAWRSASRRERADVVMVEQS
jgi:hypothetical protein